MPHKRTVTGYVKQKERTKKYKTFEQTKKEADTIRGIVKDLTPRDLLTGEIIYNIKSEPIIKLALAAGTYTYEDWRGEKTQFNLDSEKVAKIVTYDYGEVLNRAIEPCWWLSNADIPNAP